MADCAAETQGLLATEAVSVILKIGQLAAEVMAYAAGILDAL